MAGLRFFFSGDGEEPPTSINPQPNSQACNHSGARRSEWSGTQRRGRDPPGRGHTRRKFRALMSAGQRHDAEWAERNLQGLNTGGGDNFAVGLNASGGLRF